MFEHLTHKLQSAFSKFGKSKQINEANIQEIIREIRLALLDADVNFHVVSTLLKNIKEIALGQEILKSIKPSEQFVKIVHDELIKIMGEKEKPLQCKKQPTIILLCGLQGCGKTTHAAKLAHYLQKKDKRPLLAACDRQRPAAVEQLKMLASSIHVPVIEEGKTPVEGAKKAIHKAKEQGVDVVIIDTAGRLHIDEEMMKEIEEIQQATSPHEILYVASSLAGQQAAKTAQSFNERIGITGIILSMLDSDARAGAALSIAWMTQKPLLFEGIGEKLDDLQPFNPNSMADRILGYGDTINLVRKVEEHFDQKQTQELEKKMRKANFSYNDYLKQMGAMKKMGSFKGLLKMIPGASQLADLDISENQLTHTEAMILSMTPKEREGVDEMISPRRKRIAKGSGLPLDEVNQLIKRFKQAKTFIKKMPKNKMQKLLGEKLWR